MIPGKTFVFGDGVARVVPPLTFRMVKELSEGEWPAHTLIHRSLVRNYPEIKIEDMDALLDLGLAEAIGSYLGSKSKYEDRVSGETAGR